MNPTTADQFADALLRLRALRREHPDAAARIAPKLAAAVDELEREAHKGDQ